MMQNSLHANANGRGMQINCAGGDLAMFVDMNPILDSVLDDIDEIILTATAPNTAQSSVCSSSHSASPFHSSLDDSPPLPRALHSHASSKASTPPQKPVAAKLTKQCKSGGASNGKAARAVHNVARLSPSRKVQLVQANANSNNNLHGHGNNGNYNGNTMRNGKNTMFDSSDVYKKAAVFPFMSSCNMDVKLQLKDYVFISKDCTQKLAQHICRENWGKTYALLYKYLDYIFRCQAFGHQIIEIQHTQISKRYLCFNTGLQRRSDNLTLYGLFIPNNIANSQPWRVPFGPIQNSFMTNDELLQKLQKCNMAIVKEKVPVRTKFTSCLADLLYDASCKITANWEERLTLNKDRIYKVMGSIAFFDDNKKYMKTTELIDAFKEALSKTQRIAELNPRLAVAQGFVDTTNCKYRMELLLPVIIRFPSYCGNHYKFALAIGKSKEKPTVYVVKSILTMDMAYANARLVGYVDSLWLSYANNKKASSDINEFCLSP
eukprot:CAMPEP_0202689668 /NCGR_PEP_ID=MMETSP1385-20130828/4866_1 /ASSEMBLY_ACC=CAM_ASM_000861 /TAXON_ID=933848 /ORGANISM="Elphidium margaritaceum" /LENGTH=490 /DNA_ID=CAMNT_0049344831 /DNA_START=89 /DNA_END=1561 /DNA_ORIENTATION=+